MLWWSDGGDCSPRCSGRGGDCSPRVADVVVVIVVLGVVVVRWCIVEVTALRVSPVLAVLLLLPLPSLDTCDTE